MKNILEFENKNHSSNILYFFELIIVYVRVGGCVENSTKLINSLLPGINSPLDLNLYLEFMVPCVSKQFALWYFSLLLQETHTTCMDTGHQTGLPQCASSMLNQNCWMITLVTIKLYFLNVLFHTHFINWCITTEIANISESLCLILPTRRQSKN